MQLRPMNVGAAERTLRMTVGWTVVMLGMILVGAQGSSMRVVAGAALSAVGAAIFVTGYLGRCPLYRRLGHSSRLPTRARPLS